MATEQNSDEQSNARMVDIRAPKYLEWCDFSPSGRRGQKRQRSPRQDGVGAPSTHSAATSGLRVEGPQPPQAGRHHGSLHRFVVGAPCARQASSSHCAEGAFHPVAHPFAAIPGARPQNYDARGPSRDRLRYPEGEVFDGHATGEARQLCASGAKVGPAASVAAAEGRPPVRAPMPRPLPEAELRTR